MSSAADTRVSHSAHLENEKVQATSDTCGPSLPESWASYDPATRSWKTWQVTFLSDLEPFLETFPTSGTMRNGRLYPRAPWVPHIHGSECSLLPTPNAVMVKNWSYDRQRCIARAEKHQVDLCMVAITEWHGRLNPEFCETVMGFPQGHTAID